MPKTSVKTFLMLIHKLNDDIDALAEEGSKVLTLLNNIEFTSVSDLAKKDELSDVENELRMNFYKIHDMKEVLLSGLRRKIIEETDTGITPKKTKSLTINRNKPSLRKTQRIKTI